MMETCPDCGVKIGEYHKIGCDIPTCTVCGIQRLQCRCKGGNSKWTGELAPEETKICEELGLYCRTFVDGEPVTEEDLYSNLKGEHDIDWFVPCKKDDYGAHPDLNRAKVVLIQSKERE